MIEFANEGEMLTVGKLLKNERERQELTLEDISDRTKINVKYLKAIEEERKDQFPGDLYCELFTKSYAEALGLEYAKVKAGTFASSEARKDSDSRRGQKEDKSGRRAGKKAEDKPSRAGKRDRAARGAPPGADSARDVGDSAAGTAQISQVAGEEPEEREVSDEEVKAGKPDIVKYLAVTAAIIICLFIVFIYISISSRGPAGPEDQQTEETDSRIDERYDQPTLEDQLAAIEDSARLAARALPQEDSTSLIPAERQNGVAAGDTFTEGPVSIYPESLDVMLVSAERSWARVVADDDTVFTSFLEPNEVNRFKALRQLDFTLGLWERITGSIYGHPMKPMREFYVEGRGAVRFRITKSNWESFIDSTKARYEQY